MKKLLALLLTLLLAAAPMAALGEADLTQTNYETLQRALTETDVPFNTYDDIQMVDFYFDMDGRCGTVMVNGYAWEDALEFDVVFPDTVPEDRYHELCVLLMYLNNQIWMSHFYLDWDDHEVGCNAVAFTGSYTPVDGDAALDALSYAMEAVDQYGDAIYNVLLDGLDAEQVIEKLALEE